MTNYILTQDNINEIIPIETIRLICKNVTYIPEIEYLINLIYFDCSDNNLEYIPTLPINVNFINCSKNKLTYLQDLSENIIYLNCEENKINELPKLSIQLYYLNCKNNKLNYLPRLPENMVYFYYNYNNFNDEMNEILHYYHQKTVKPYTITYGIRLHGIFYTFNHGTDCIYKDSLQELCRELNDKGYINNNNFVLK
jgi:hypothetical protein